MIYLSNYFKLGVFVAVSMGLNACGQKGALYLPEKSQTPIVSPVAQPADDSNQPAISDNPQNSNIILDDQQANPNDY